MRLLTSMESALASDWSCSRVALSALAASESKVFSASSTRLASSPSFW